MPFAELIDDRVKDQPDLYGHSVRIAHLRTTHGVASIRSELTDNAVEDYIFVGGLLSGGAYERAVCAVATAGHIGRTIRHGSNNHHNAIDADADEVVGVIEALSQGHNVHIIAHSKGGRVAVRAAARLGPDTKIAEVMLVNPALERSHIPHDIGELAGTVIEHAAVYLQHPWRMARAARGVLHELSHRPQGIVGEVAELFSDQDFTDDFAALDDRRVPLTLVRGGFDHVVPGSSTTALESKYKFDKVINLSGLVRGGHYGIVALDGYMQDMGMLAS